MSHFLEANAEKAKSHQSMNELAKIAGASLASEFRSRLLEYIRIFDKELDQDHEVGIRLVSFGQAITFHVDSVGYYNPSLITFNGTTEDGKRVKLVQHVTQLSFLLVALPKSDPNKPKKPFGFADR